MNKLAVNKIIPFSSVDGPGNRMAIFLQDVISTVCIVIIETINHCNHCEIYLCHIVLLTH